VTIDRPHSSIDPLSSTHRIATRVSRRTAFIACGLTFSAACAGQTTAPEDCAVPPPASLSWSAAQSRLSSCNRDVLVAKRNADAVKADILIAGQRPNPTVSVGVGQYAPAVGLGAGNLLEKQVDYLGRIDQPIERGNKRELRKDLARNSWVASQWAVADALRQSQLALALAWIDLWGAQERVRLQRELTALYRKALEVAQLRLKAGDVAANDVARIDLDVQRAEGDRILANSDLARARSVVAALLAIDSDSSRLQAIEPWPISAGAAWSQQPQSLEDRPDIQSARAQELAAQSRSNLARSQQIRDISIGFQVDRYAPPSGLGWLYGVYVAFPLFINHRFEGEIARAQADVESAIAERTRLEHQARANLARLDESRLLARLRRERIEREALPLAEKVAANADLAYRKGAGSVLELLDALRQLRALQLDVLTARLDEDRSDASARAEVLTVQATADPVFGESLRLGPQIP